MKIFFFPRYNWLGPSSRYRIYQYINLFKEQGIDCEIFPLLNGSYFNKSRFYKIKIFIAYIRRLIILISVKDRPLLYIEKELFPYFLDFVFVIKLKRIKYILDYDDAIFHEYENGRFKLFNLFLKFKIEYILKNATGVVTGSPYLTKYLSKYNSNIIEIPTSINFAKYSRRKSIKKSKDFVIGWIGSKTTSKHILLIKNALIKFSSELDCKINLIGFDNELRFHFSNINNIRFIEWDKNTEIEEICNFTVGIMPLPAGPFENGKCGFKLIQYMACGVPTISSPLSANIKINHNNGNLFAENDEQWINSFKKIYMNSEFYRKIGDKNIEIVEEFYSIESNYSKYLEVFQTLR